MKRFIKAAPLIIVTFILGVVSTLAWARLYTRRVSLCEIAQNPGAYHDKRVRVEASASVVSLPSSEENSLYIYEAGCTADGALAGVWFDRDSQLSPEVDKFINSRTVEIREATVVVEGVFDEWATMGCFAPQFGVKNATVRLQSDITSQPLPARLTHDNR